MSSEQQPPVNNGHYFWVLRVVVVHRFEVIFECSCFKTALLVIEHCCNRSTMYCTNFCDVTNDDNQIELTRSFRKKRTREPRSCYTNVYIIYAGISLFLHKRLLLKHSVT